MFTKLKHTLQRKALITGYNILTHHLLKYINHMQNTSWKTTLAGLVTGAIPIGKALLQAYTSGKFTGESAAQVAIGAGVIILGYLAKDAHLPGAATPPPTDNTNA